MESEREKQLFRNAFECLPIFACIVEKNNLEIRVLNKIFKDKVVSGQKTIGNSFPSLFLTSKGRVDFLDAVDTMINSSSNSITVDDIETTFDKCYIQNGGIVSLFRWTVTDLDSSTFLLTGQVTLESVQPSHEKNMLRKSELIEFFMDAPIGLHCVDGEGRFLWANDTMLNMLGYTADEYIGHMVWEFCPDQDVEDLGRDSLEHLEAAPGHALRNLPFKLRMKNGDIKHVVVDSNACYHADGTFSHTRCYVRDDHERIVQTAVLEDRADKYRLMSAEKDRFIRVTFHQIRTPLHALAATLAAAATTEPRHKKSPTATAVGVERQDALVSLQIENTSDTAEQQEFSLSACEIEELKSQLDSCLGLVDDLAFATMFESDNVLQPRPVKLRMKREVEKIIRSVELQQLGGNCGKCRSDNTIGGDSATTTADTVISSSGPNCVQFELKVSEDVPYAVFVDRSVLRVLNNIINNAAKFSARNSVVTVTLSFEPTTVGNKDDQQQQHQQQQQQQEEQDTTQPRLCGSLTFSVSNKADKMMDLAQIHRAFQNYFSHPVINPVVNNNSSSSNGSSNCRQTDSRNTTNCSGNNINNSNVGGTCQISQSLTSSEGLGLGLYVSYNIIQSLGGLLECSAAEEESRFWFTLSNVEVQHTPQSQQQSSSCAPSPRERNNRGSSGSSSSVLGPSQSVDSDGTSVNDFHESWAQVEDSAVGTKHVITADSRTSYGSCFLSSTYSHSHSSNSIHSIHSSAHCPLDRAFTSSPALDHKTRKTMPDSPGGDGTGSQKSQQDSATSSSSGGDSRHSSAAAVTAVPKRQRVLVVDDSPICRKVLVKNLISNGFDCDTASDGQDACDKLRFDPCLYDAVLMDLRMPIMDGITATRLCKQRRHLSSVPFIIVTAELGEEVRQACVVAGAAQFIEKPAQMGELVEAIYKVTSCADDSSSNNCCGVGDVSGGKRRSCCDSGEDCGSPVGGKES